MTESESKVAPLSTPRRRLRLASSYASQATTHSTTTPTPTTATRSMTHNNNTKGSSRLFARFLSLTSPPPPTSTQQTREHPDHHHRAFDSADHHGDSDDSLSVEANNHHHNFKSSINTIIKSDDDSNNNTLSIGNNNSTLTRMGSTNDSVIIEKEEEEENDDIYNNAAAAADHEFAITLQQKYEICETIDDSMLGLHASSFTLTSTKTLSTTNDDDDDADNELTSSALAPTIINGRSKEVVDHTSSSDYDWILDGTDDDDDHVDDDEEEDEEGIEWNNASLPLTGQQRRRDRNRRELGDVELDKMLGRMELESSASSFDASTTNSCVSRKRCNSSSSCESVVDEKNKETVSTEEEMVEFGDFSSAFSTENGGVFYGDEGIEHHFAGCDMTKQEEVVCNSAKREESIASTEIIPTVQSSDLNETIVSPAMESRKDDDGNNAKEEIDECKPPESIKCLVSNLDAELDAAVTNCSHLPQDQSSDIVSEQLILKDGSDDKKTSEMIDTEISQPVVKMASSHQSLLMSSILLESLPLPMPSSLSDDLAASFTRRIQKYHRESLEEVCCEFDAARSVLQIQDEKLEQILSDTIHGGYFEEDGTDYFDPIVMEEILNVPWPFHFIDINESFLNDEESDDPDTDERSIDDIHFDTYISNRLAELDFATGEIMDCLLSRVYQQEGAINNGVENIFSAEIAISTAILYSNSCREFLHNARKGYQLSSVQHDLTGQHNVISAGLDVLQIADNKDRLQDLLATIDEIFLICNKELHWIQDVTTNVIAHQRFMKILADAKELKDMVPRAEVLNHVTCLFPMRVRLNCLHEVLLDHVEESLAHLFSRVLQSDENNAIAFDEYRTEYESIFDAWISCFQMTTGKEESAQQSLLSAIERAWSACIIKILCFEIKKAVALSIIDSHLHERSTINNDENSAIKEIQLQLCKMRLNLMDESTLETLSQRLMSLPGVNHSNALSSPFFHLGSRLVEIMNLYDMTVQWLEAFIARADVANEPVTFILPLQNGSGISHSEHSVVSSVSSEKQLSSSADEKTQEENLNNEISSRPLPDCVEFERFCCLSTLDAYTTVLKVTECIRRKICETCELALIQLVQVYMSQATRVGTEESTDSATRNFHSTYDVLMQFNAFLSYFATEVDDDGSRQCVGLESELSKVYLNHLRSVHVEAMKTTGTILRHEAWQLSPLELPRCAATSNKKNCTCIFSQQNCAHCKEVIMKSVYQAVGDIILGSVHDNRKPESRRLITERAERRGYRHLSSFGRFLDNNFVSVNTSNLQQSQWRVQGCGIASDEFASAVLPFIELNACGKRAISVLTQSSSNGLARWATRLLSIGNALPLVSNDASSAVMALVDLYVLTVFRFCAGNKLNEDVLIGFGRGSAANSSASTSVSLTIEADAVAPLPRERRAFVQTQEFITSSRNRLKDIVNLDKFQSSSDMCPTSPRSKNVVSNFARRLEKEAAAACSCYFVAVLVDVLSTIFSDRKDQISEQQPLWIDLKDMETSIENQSNCTHLKQYAAKFVAVVPHLVAQFTRYAAVNSISGKELLFQIICCGRTYENENMQEHSNAYVDGLCERAACLWGHLSSSTTLPPPALHYTWNHVVWSAFRLLLEGFSKVTCSMEGRSLMSMDLATLSHGLMPETVMTELDDDFSGIGPPPQSCREEMMRYVDTFIKVFYFPYEDILSWIQGNAKDYHIEHSMSLIKASGSKDKNFIAQGMQAIDVIYCELRP